MNIYSIQLYDRQSELCPVFRGEAEHFDDAIRKARRLLEIEQMNKDLKDPAIKSISMIGTKDF